MRYAVIESEIVVNVAVWDGSSPWSPGEGLIAVRSDEAGIGWSYDPETGAFSAPVEAPVEPPA